MSDEEKKVKIEIDNDGIRVEHEDGNDEWKWNKNDEKKEPVNEKKSESTAIYALREFPFVLFVVVAYLLLGFVGNMWHPGWVIFLLIPIWYSLVSAIRNRNFFKFAYPLLVAVVYILIGVFMDAWHPGWVIFFTIPLYDWVAKVIHKSKSGKN